MTIIEKIKLNYARKKHETHYQQNRFGNPLISVRIPTHNRSDLLFGRAIASLNLQTYTRFNVVIVGDNCTDDTEKLIKERTNNKVLFRNLPPRSKKELALLKDPETRWFMGPVRPTNKCTQLCTGDWVAHIDDDDIWTEEHLFKLLRFAQDGDYEWVSSGLLRVKNGKQEAVYDENGYGGCQTWLYRKYVADIFRYNPNCYKKKWNRVSDVDVAERMKSAGVRMGFLKELTAIILPRPGEDTIGLEAYKTYEHTIRSIC